MPYKRKRGEEEKKDKDKTFQKRYLPRRRWVVERTNSWHNRFRKLFTQYEKKGREPPWVGATVLQYHNL